MSEAGGDIFKMPQPFTETAVQNHHTFLPQNDAHKRKHLDTEVGIPPGPFATFREGQFHRRPQACLDSDDTALSLK